MNMMNSKKNNSKRMVLGGQTVEVRFDHKGMTFRATRGANIVPEGQAREFIEAVTRIQDNELKNQIRTAQAVYGIYKEIGNDIKSLLADPTTIADINRIGETLKAIKAVGTEVENFDPSDFEDVH